MSRFLRFFGDRDSQVTQDEELVANSGLFDARWYTAQYSDVPRRGIGPVRHFLQRGAKEGRDPNPFFRTTWYLNRYPDIDRNINPLVHYFLHGAGEERDPHPDFSTVWYFRKYPDVGQSGLNPLAHFLRVGVKEGRVPSPRLAAPFVEEHLNGVRRWEPDLDALDRIRSVYALPLGGPPINSPIFRSASALLSGLTAGCERLVLVPNLAGPAALHAIKLLRTAQEPHGASSVLLLATDSDDRQVADQLPRDARFHVVPGVSGLTLDERVNLVVCVMTALKPRAVANVESLAGWYAFERFGRGLSTISDLHAFVVAEPHAAESTMSHWRTFLRPTIAVLKRVHVDGENLMAEMADLFQLTPSQRMKLSSVNSNPTWI